MPKRAKKRSGGKRREIGSAQRMAKQLAQESERLHRNATTVVGKIEDVESNIHRIHQAAEHFHDSTGEVEKTIHNVEIENRPETLELEERDPSGSATVRRSGPKVPARNRK